MAIHRRDGEVGLATEQHAVHDGRRLGRSSTTDGDAGLVCRQRLRTQLIWYRNENGTFQDDAASAGVEDIASGMSVSLG